MVTLDVDAALQPQLMEELLTHGMDIARINCAHGTKKEWKMIIEATRDVEERLTQRGQDVKRKCRIVMDLAGPKIRTGPMPLELRPLRIVVPKDVHNRPVRMVEGFLDSEAPFTEKISLTGVDPSFVISLSNGRQTLSTLNVGERLSLIDTRGRPRAMVILERTSPTMIRVGIEKTTYLQEGIRLQRQKRSTPRRNSHDCPNHDHNTTNTSPLESTHSVASGCNNDSGSSVLSDNNHRQDDNTDSDIDSIVVGRISPQPIDVEVTSGDKLILLKTAINDPFRVSISDSVTEISCTLPEILHNVQQGHRVFIDDGKIGAVVLSHTEDYLPRV